MSEIRSGYHRLKIFTYVVLPHKNIIKCLQFDYKALLCVKMAVASKCQNEITEAVGNIKHHHSEHRLLCSLLTLVTNYSISNFTTCTLLSL